MGGVPLRGALTFFRGESMGFQLKVHFTGLCLFVPDEIGSSGRGTMYVLMPPTGTASTYGVHDHHVHLYLADASGSRPDRASRVEMKGWGLEFGGAGGSSAMNVYRIVGLRQHTQKPVPRRHLGPQTSGGGAFHKPAARVTLGSGSITYHDPGAQWILGGEEVCLPYFVTWTIDVPQNQFKLELHDLIDPGTKRFVADLGPSDTEIWIAHAMPNDMPGSSGPPTQPPEADHFIAFYDLYDDPAHTPIPWADNPECQKTPIFPHPLIEHFAGPEGFLGASPFTCMTASGPP
jgi:hypothetical protein